MPQNWPKFRSIVRYSFCGSSRVIGCPKRVTEYSDPIDQTCPEQGVQLLRRVDNASLSVRKKRFSKSRYVYLWCQVRAEATLVC
jgi:hypothetical protein